MTEYSINFDPGTGILEVRVEGFWNQDAMTRFVTELSAAMAELRASGTTFGVLGDGSHFAVQSQDIAQGVTRLVDADNQQGRAPTAIVAGSALVKMQAMRAMAASHLRVFETRAEALAWLAQAINPPRASAAATPLEQPSHVISFDDEHRILKVTLSGFWDLETLRGFDSALSAQLAALRLDGRPFSILGDGRTFDVQPPAILNGFMEVVAPIARMNRRLTALVMSGALGQIQAERIMAAPHLRVFPDYDEAWHWLCSTNESPK